MSEFTVLRARLGAHALHAKYSRAEIAAMGAEGRKNARTKLELSVIEEHHLDRTAPDFEARLRHGIKTYYTRLALKAAQSRARQGKERGPRSQ